MNADNLARALAAAHDDLGDAIERRDWRAVELIRKALRGELAAAGLHERSAN